MKCTIGSFSTGNNDKTAPGRPIPGREEATMKIHKFCKSPADGVYLSPVYVRDDGKYKIASVDRWIWGTWKRVFEVTNEAGEVVDRLLRLRDAKIAYEKE